MFRLILSLLFCGLALSAEPLFEQSAFTSSSGGKVDGWQAWTPRPDTSPRLFVDDVVFRSEPGSLAVSGASNVAACGGWERVVEPVQQGQWYRFVAYYRAENMQYEPRQVVARLDWVSAKGTRAGRPDYVYSVTVDGGWKRLTHDAPAPSGSVGVKLQLLLWGAPEGTVWWDDISLTPVPAPKPREVTIATIKLRPENGTPESNVDRFIETIDKVVPPKADMIVLPEGITVVGTNRKYGEVGEPVPGPSTRKLAEAAKRHDSYIVAGIYEKEGSAIYNTAVLIDRDGRIAGKYRKVYIPREETEAGLAPGSDYPVFQTDFGKVGMMICWDVQYADPARGLALRGAEIILMPIWGGNVTLARARAIENHLFLVSSGYDYPTHIIDPDGKIIAVAKENGAAAVATIDLNKRYLDDWLGDMRARFMKELRLDVPVEPVAQLR